jgi:hypothetical protein
MHKVVVWFLAGVAALCGGAPAYAGANPPNIIFFVMDDVGIDHMRLYGYGDPGVNNGRADRRTRLPNIEAIAARGVTFTNAWAMPECSPSRAAFFTGRLPLRTNVLRPIQPPDLANSQVSPYALTLPKLLKTEGYVSGLIGKMHLSGSAQEPSTNPLGNETYRDLGFDYFNGYLDASPLSVDTQAGLRAAAVGTYSCGFIPNRTTDPSHGADAGTCYYADGTSQYMSTASHQTPGRACLESGGILDPSLTPSPANVNFDTHNGYYTANWVENLEDGVTTRVHPPGDASVDPGEYRGYRSIVEADRAIAWINEKQSQNTPWMATVGFSSAHTPWHNVPASILPADSVNTDGYRCTVGLTPPQLRILQQQMEEGLDHELGRILVETGIASYNADGSLDYDPQSSNTLIVIVSDNGTFGPTVNRPFDGARAKGTPYQTGVWVPLIAAGPMVKSPGRQVSEMVNAVDLYKLFAEVAGIDADTVVPKAQRLDAQNMLPYLTQANDGRSIRVTNLVMTGENPRLPQFSDGTTCVLGAPYNACTLFFPRQPICEKNGGIWYGPGSQVPGVPAAGLADCCAVNAFREANGQAPVIVDQLRKAAVRDDNFKLVEVVWPDCSTPAPRATTTRTEFYRIDEESPTPLLDTEANDLLKDGRSVDELTRGQRKAYTRLERQLGKWNDTVVASCPGDGNSDLVVDEKDLEGYIRFAASPEGTGSGLSSWYDFNLDGLTDQADLGIIYDHWGLRCRPQDNAEVR